MLAKVTVILYSVFLIFGVLLSLWITPPFLKESPSKTMHILFTGASYFLFAGLILLSAAFQIFYYYPIPSNIAALIALGLGVIGMMYLNQDAKEKRR